MRRTSRSRSRLSSLTLATAFGALTAIALVGCATAGGAGARPAPVDTHARALIYGHIEAPQPVQAVQLAKMLSPSRPSAHVLENGDFYFDDIAPGHYGLLRFMAGGKWYYLLTGDKENNRRFIVEAAAGGMHYVGAWRVTGEKDNRFTPDQFTIDRVAAPADRALLQRLRPALAGTGWESRIAAAAPRADDAAATRKQKAASK